MNKHKLPFAIFTAILALLYIFTLLAIAAPKVMVGLIVLFAMSMCYIAIYAAVNA